MKKLIILSAVGFAAYHLLSKTTTTDNDAPKGNNNPINDIVVKDPFNVSDTNVNDLTIDLPIDLQRYFTNLTNVGRLGFPQIFETYDGKIIVDKSGNILFVRNGQIAIAPDSFLRDYFRRYPNYRPIIVNDIVWKRALISTRGNLTFNI